MVGTDKSNESNGETNESNGETNESNGKTNESNGKTNESNGKTNESNGKTMSTQVIAFLVELKLDKYVTLFEDCESMEDILYLTRDDMIELGIPLIPRKRLIRGIEAYQSADATARAKQLVTSVMTGIQEPFSNAERFFNMPVRKCSVSKCSLVCFNEKVSFCRTHLCSRFTNNGCKRGGKEVNHHQFGKKKCLICRQNQHKSYRKISKKRGAASKTDHPQFGKKRCLICRQNQHKSYRKISKKRGAASKTTENPILLKNFIDNFEPDLPPKFFVRYILPYVRVWMPLFWRNQLIKRTKAVGVFSIVKEIGFCVVEGALSLPATNEEITTKLAETPIETIFETFEPDAIGKPKTQFGSRKRKQTKPRSSTSKIFNWGQPKLGRQIKKFLKAFSSFGYNLTFVRLESHEKCPAQAVHCDHAAEGVYRNSDGMFNMNAIIPISSLDDTFIDIRPLGTSRWMRILLRRGDLLLFRGDVAHRGVEHKYPYTHYRIHCYCDMQGCSRETNQTIYVGCPFEAQPMYYWFL